jgi:hypothetical protein
LIGVHKGEGGLAGEANGTHCGNKAEVRLPSCSETKISEDLPVQKKILNIGCEQFACDSQKGNAKAERERSDCQK